MAKLALALALAPAVTAFAPVAAPKAATKLEASIADTLATMEGPEIFWGSDGVLLGHDEADIKGYDNFDQLAAALSKEGVDLSGGEYTLLAPANSAFDKHNNEVGTPITADVLKYHVIEGKKTMDALNTDQKTLNGGTLTAYRKFRKNWLDGAIIGLKSEGPSKSSNWPSDVECDNGIIQAIDTVLVPGAYDNPAAFAVWPVAGGIGRLVKAPKKASTELQASITETLATLNGPEIFWGSDGVALGHDEADIKGYDNFDQLAAALSKEGIDLSGGEYTLLAPANSAFDKHNKEVGTPITADVLKYHVIEGKKTMDALNTDQKTLNGGTLTAYRKFRKNWLDGAIIGLKSEGPSKSSNWPSDVECDNGIIHAIDTVLVPGAYEGSR